MSVRLTPAEAAILSRAARRTLVQSLLGDRLWSLLEDPFTLFDDLSPRRLRAAGLIELGRPGSLAEDRPDEYRVTVSGQAALAAFALSQRRDT